MFLFLALNNYNSHEVLVACVWLRLMGAVVIQRKQNNTYNLLSVLKSYSLNTVVAVDIFRVRTEKHRNISDF